MVLGSQSRVELPGEATEPNGGWEASRGIQGEERVGQRVSATAEPLGRMCPLCAGQRGSFSGMGVLEGKLEARPGGACAGLVGLVDLCETLPRRTGSHMGIAVEIIVEPGEPMGSPVQEPRWGKGGG